MADDPLAGGLATLPAVTGGGVGLDPVPTFDPSLVKEYLFNVLPLLLGSPDPQEQEAIALLFSFPDVGEKCRRFAHDPQTPVLYVLKEVEETPEDDAPHVAYNLAHELTYRANHVGSVALIKRGPTLDPARPLAHQVQVMNLPGPAAQRDPVGPANPYEALHAYIHHAVGPYFNAYVAQQQQMQQQAKGSAEPRDDKDAKTGIPVAKKKIAELELSLLHLQQNVDIPDVVLTLHPAVVRAAAQCREAGTRVTAEALDPALLADSAFLNRLQGDVNGWIKEIQKVTKLSRDPASGTASQEINFWLSMERALERIDTQLKSDEVVLTLDVLKHAKRFLATVSFVADTGLNEGMDKVAKYNQLMRDFPLDELLAATDVGKVRDALMLIFAHLNKKLRLSPYPVRRALPLVEAISRDLHDTLLKVLGRRRLMPMDYVEFAAVADGADQVFAVWDDQVKDFTNVAREVTRKRMEKFLPIKIRPAHAPLQERFAFLRQFRLQHAQLHATIARVTQAAALDGPLADDEGAVDAVAEVGLAYASVQNVDVLDVSPEGTEVWVAAERIYTERVARVENLLIRRLRDRLATARNAMEMFRVFGKFNALFVRPKIRGAIQEYQARLIENVKDDIRRLHDTFKRQYRHSEACRVGQLRDVPPVAGAILWARQLERQLATYMARVEAVLGKGWELYAEGQRLAADSASFRRKLDARPVYDAWYADVTRRDQAVAGRIFTVSRVRAAGNALQLDVNFDPGAITLFKEVRHLAWLGFPVPHAVANAAKDAKRVYPFAVSLIETTRAYRRTVHELGQHPLLVALAAAHLNDVHHLVAGALHLRWDYFVNAFDPQAHRLGTLDVSENEHVGFVRSFARTVATFQTKTAGLITASAAVDASVAELGTCPYDHDAFAAVLARVQRHVDQLNLEGFANLPAWVRDLDARIAGVLGDRLLAATAAWTTAFARDHSSVTEAEDDGDDEKGMGDTRRHGRTTRTVDASPPEVLPALTPRRHELRLRNQVMYLDPPLEQARAGWYAQLHAWLGAVGGLPRLESSRYETGLAVGGPADLAGESETRVTYAAALLPTLPLGVAYAAIERKYRTVDDYVRTWLRYQSLWDLEPEHVFGKLGDDLGRWQQILGELRQARAPFDTAATTKRFGPLVIDYGQVQGKVTARYDAWQRDVLHRFGAKLGAAAAAFHTAVAAARRDLERHTVATRATAEAVTFITFVAELQRKVPAWTAEVAAFRAGQRTLERQRYVFPADWLFADQLEGEWSAFADILGRQNRAIQDQLSGLQAQIGAEATAVGQRTQDAVRDWEQTKPVAGDLGPTAALATLRQFAERADGLLGEAARVDRAREALQLPRAPDRSLEPVREEIADLTAVWTALAGTWTALDELRELPWASVVPRKVRQRLDALLGATRELPARMRSYQAYEYVQSILRRHVKANALVADLKSDALRDRHWRALFRALRVDDRPTLSTLTLGYLWDLDLRRHEAAVREVVTAAQGEMALEEFLKGVRETWATYTLDLVNYQNRCRLIRGWDDLFAKAGEHQAALSAMKASPYYKAFADEATGWEEKLNRVSALFDVWIDVQRQWVYLEGIFSGSADIKHLLPVESARFATINAEFLGVMKKVYKSPLVLDVLNLPNVHKSLERLADLLGKIQKALGEYLERERSAFPRFYFVGDEDLLEIIGNGQAVARIQKHFAKMFAGLATVLLNAEDEMLIEGMASREGETVRFASPVSLRTSPKINEWLSALEQAMRVTLAERLGAAVTDLIPVYTAAQAETGAWLAWADAHPAQLVVLAAQAVWTGQVEAALRARDLTGALGRIEAALGILADAVLTPLAALTRRKCEHLITELVHQRDVVRQLAQETLPDDDGTLPFAWLYHMRYYYNSEPADPLARLTVRMADAAFPYGFEYLGVPDRLVQTPLTDRCYLTLTQALHAQLGGSPFGPAGTGKTESVKALGAQLGRFVLVFCCDETFDFQAMGRIFVGLAQVGAWGCFDEFNRLEERILSAVSQQIQSIQLGLQSAGTEVELVGKPVRVHRDTGVFITMNPGYAGRSHLPDNLKKLFRSIAMTRPDRELIAQVMLYSQGFRTAERLAAKVVPLFTLCAEQLSPQPHYDFGLRALKAVLVSAGNLQRELGDAKGNGDDAAEQGILIQSVRETLVPKLVADDIPLLTRLLADVFPGVAYRPADLAELRAALAAICAERHYVPADAWLAKVVQLYQIQRLHHGLMLVGPSGTGKSAAWRTLLAALERVEGRESVSYVIDPKAISKDDLYGTLDPTTREWTDGLFTHILRRIVDNVRGERAKRHWVVFDGDVDPEWVENLNSVLDDNRLLTLPNGERLALPDNVRLLFEVDTLRYATPATVSRCGMVWFSEDCVTPAMACERYLATLRSRVRDPDAEDDDDDSGGGGGGAPDGPGSSQADPTDPALLVQRTCADAWTAALAADGLVPQALARAAGLRHIMDFTPTRALATLFSLLDRGVSRLVAHNLAHPDFPLPPDQVTQHAHRRLLLDLLWSFAGDCSHADRQALSSFVAGTTTVVDLPAGVENLLDYDAAPTTPDWTPWQAAVPAIEMETHQVAAADVIVPTVDTVRHEAVLYAWLAERRPLLLCGPPGSGKTMTLFGALRKLPDVEVVGLNFSSATTPALLLKTFEQYCEYRRTPTGPVLSPATPGRWLVVFCDEVNLPAPDRYGTQRVVAFLRQLVERGGFWRARDRAWVRLSRVQFVGACNPPTDPGRVPLAPRFLRHAPLVLVDYPGAASLRQIYGTFARALLKLVPTLRAYAEPLTAATVEFYLASQQRFTPDVQAHYVYSPRELTRWMRGLHEALAPLDHLPVEGLVRVWAHEGLRLFQDRLVDAGERRWTDDMVDQLARTHFPTIDHDAALARPILFSNWLSKDYVAVDREELRRFAAARLKVFYEEELDVPLVLFNDVLDHVLRIDRVFRQVQGHLLLIGVSGGGKTTLTRFVAWMNGLAVVQIKAHNRYTAADFDDDLRAVLRRAGCKGEKVCFVLDESNVLDAGFLERMNTLLANAEVPGLFEGDEYATLLTQCREGAARDGLLLDTGEELYRWFTGQVRRNLHVVFTMNPPEGGLGNRAATSPALFNRCVLDWFGDWSTQALYQVGREFTHALDLDLPAYPGPADAAWSPAHPHLSLPPAHRDAVVDAFVYVHASLGSVNARLARRSGRTNHVTPRHYLDFIQHYVRLFTEKRTELEEQQRHLHVGLDKLQATVAQVEELSASLGRKNAELDAKNIEANEQLQRMVTDQQTAESQRKASLEYQTVLAEKDRAIAERRAVVLGDLERAEPAVQEAQRAVSGIRKQQLTEVRAMANPPEAVKLAMESVCTLLGHRLDGWKSVQAVIRRDDFIASIVNFDTDRHLTRKLREHMRTTFLNNPSFNFETVNRASRACGPLVAWVIAQVDYAEILERVGPLRAEVAALEDDAAATRASAAHLETTVAELEASIARYKEEYARLISETQRLKAEMGQVSGKVDRSMTLLNSLESEKGRWIDASATFEAQMGTVVGDVLLAAAFLAYGGYFDQAYRELLLTRWSDRLRSAGVAFKSDLSLTEYLSTAEDRLSWAAADLPADDLCTENAVMLHRFNRYPLVIDPAGQAAAFLSARYRDRRLTVTSFLDASFLKNLESALRFGNPLLITDAEHLDPVLNPVLNRELRRTGGRVLIRLGGSDIDFSPAFTLFLATRDPTVQFPPDVCSRVTFVNFTVTRGSLQSQCLHRVLRHERPDTDRKRTDLVRLQGEFRLRLRHLERSLLQALSSARGNLLDDDAVIGTLETLKREAAEVATKVAETETVMTEIDAVLAAYTPLATACSAVFFTLEALPRVHHFYQFALAFFEAAFSAVLRPDHPRLQGVTDPAERLTLLRDALFDEVYRRAAPGLLHADRLTLLTLLAPIKWRTVDPDAAARHEATFDLVLTGEELAVTETVSDVGNVPAPVVAHGGPTAPAAFRALVRALPEGASLTTVSDEAWATFFAATEPETSVPGLADPSADDPAAALHCLAVVRSLRPDRVLPAAQRFAARLFDPNLVADATIDLATMVRDEVTAAVPVALCAVPGHDASYLVDQLAKETGVTLRPVALGSAEGFTLADAALAAAVKTGTWVLLKNVHLAPAWLGQLEKRLHALTPHPAFRLFLTMEIQPNVPANILRLARVLMIEPPPGLRAGLLQSLRRVPAARFAAGPAERARLYFLLAWLHAVAVERLRYAPLGWTQTYAFNDADQACALATVDHWLASAAAGRANVDPDRIPWRAVRTLLTESVYGGRLDNVFDQRLLESLVGTLFRPASFDLDVPLAPGADPPLPMPEGTRPADFIAWVERLPEHEPPAWLGLPADAERLLLTNRGRAMLGKVRRMKSLADDDEVAYRPDAPTAGAAATSDAPAQPAWMRSVAQLATTWLTTLPEQLTGLARDPERLRDPLYRVFWREVDTGSRLLARVRCDLTDLAAVCAGTLPQTNHLRALLDSANRGAVPTAWAQHTVPASFTLGQWLGDLHARLNQLRAAAEAGGAAEGSALATFPVWLGGLFFPEAFVTATRQTAAQRRGCSIEQLRLGMVLGTAADSTAFTIRDLRLEGAALTGEGDGGAVGLCLGSVTLATSQLRWLPPDEMPAAESVALLPVYLNGDRRDLLFAVPIAVVAADAPLLAPRGVALVAGV
ncbi:dynein heavy chain [Tieghemiomyces parasiticus]|uniref:Dynein heavy chain, cytoplasmic n=1 Tax=Tieghemiomyces parasiticus TaxID=78921 RepID=A0A9W8AMN5_9FUNG|nr:dynein heavy chain [Tieghemiomyces parasiticus]